MRTGRFGASNRKLVDKAARMKKARYECKKCRKLKVRRRSNALWVCSSCGATYAGGAYSMTTEVGDVSNRVISEYSKS